MSSLLSMTLASVRFIYFLFLSWIWLRSKVDNLFLIMKRSLIRLYVINITCLIIYIILNIWYVLLSHRYWFLAIKKSFDLLRGGFYPLQIIFCSLYNPRLYDLIQWPLLILVAYFVHSKQNTENPYQHSRDGQSQYNL